MTTGLWILFSVSWLVCGGLAVQHNAINHAGRQARGYDIFAIPLGPFALPALMLASRLRRRP